MTGRTAARSARLSVCVRNDRAEHLVVRCIDSVVPEPDTDAMGFVRVIDESDEDYVHPASYFVELQLAPDLEQALLSTVQWPAPERKRGSWSSRSSARSGPSRSWPVDTRSAMVSDAGHAAVAADGTRSRASRPSVCPTAD